MPMYPAAGTAQPPSTKVYSFKDFSDTMHEMSALKLSDCRDVADLGLRLKDLNDKLLMMAGGAGEPTADVHLIMNFIQNLGPRYRIWKEELLRGHRLVSDVPQDPTVLRFNDVFVKALMQEQVFEREDRATTTIMDEIEVQAQDAKNVKQRQEYEEAKRKLREDPDALKKLTEEHERTVKKYEERAANRQALAKASAAMPAPVGKGGIDISEPLARTKASMAAKMHEAMKQIEAFKQMQLDEDPTAAKTKTKAKAKQEQKQAQNPPPPAKVVPPTDLADPTELLKSVAAAANAAENAAKRHAEMLRSFMATTGQNGHR